MICENCSKDFSEDWRIGKKRGLLRFCSSRCAKRRKQTDAIREAKSKASKAAWKRGVYKNQYNHTFSKADRKKGIDTCIEKAKTRNAELLATHQYEKMSNEVRRRFILDEVNHACESCHNSEWLGKPIWLEIHHKDDDNTNNKRDNLLVLCPNCHSAIDEKYRFRGRSRKKTESSSVWLRASALSEA